MHIYSLSLREMSWKGIPFENPPQIVVQRRRPIKMAQKSNHHHQLSWNDCTAQFGLSDPRIILLPQQQWWIPQQQRDKKNDKKIFILNIRSINPKWAYMFAQFPP
jgi:hypothetical protein